MDATVSANSTRINRWINLVIADIAGRFPATWLQERAIVQTVVEKTAGTVEITDGSATVTGTSTAFASTDKRSFIQFEGDTNWYEVTAVASQVLTISPAFAGTTAAAATYTLRKVFYNLPSACQEVIDVRQSKTPAKLTRLGVWTMDTYQPDIQTTAPPVGYNVFRIDPDTGATAAKQLQMSFYPIPDDEYNMEIRYVKQLADLSADGDIPMLPQSFHLCIADGAEWLGAKFLNSDKEPGLKQAYEFGVQKMIDRENTYGDYLPVLGTGDTQSNTAFIRFPAHFEQP